MLHYNKTLENTKLNLPHLEVILPLLIPLAAFFFFFFQLSSSSRQLCFESSLLLIRWCTSTVIPWCSRIAWYTPG